MKKENKKLAQQRRAKERKKEVVMKVLGKVAMIGIPTMAFLLLVGLILANPFAKNEVLDDSEEPVENVATTLVTDKTLEVKNGDTVNIDYVGSVDGVEFAGGSTEGNGTDLTIGSGMYIDDFEEQLIGSHPGDEVEVVVTFPEEYGNEELNGKEAVFKVVVNGIYQ